MDSEQDKPTDLSMKATRKVKHIPPPLDLNAHTLEQEQDHHVRVPKSPNELPRECLPIRKRHLVEASGNSAFHSKSPKSAGMDGIAFRLTTPVDLSAANPSNGRHTAPSSPLVTHTTSSTLSLTPSSATSGSNFSHFPVPPPLIPVPQNSGSATVAAVMAMANAFNNSKAKNSSSGFPTPPTDVHSPYAWTHSASFHAAAAAAAVNSPFSPLPLSPFPVTSLLSPTASHPSSLSSSREDIQNTVEREMMKRRLLPPSSVASHYDAQPPASPLWSFGGAPIPTPVWQCFQMGCRIKFLLPSTDAPWQKVEELAWKDHVAMKIDARNSYQYAPNGLILVQADESNKNLIHNEDAVASSLGKASAEVLLRFSPAHLSGAPDILVEAPVTHPFLVKDKGWCSLNPTATANKYGIRCHDLSVGDLCLPPNHPEAIRTPDLCDRFKRFEFSSPAAGENDLTSPRAIGGSAFIFGNVPTSTSSVASTHAKGSPPPPSPAKIKKEKDCDKPKRPMNGFMLFAKKYRLELIQQHPGKDNRAISVLLGEAWKSLPLEERESYSNKAKVLADEQKKIYPDCWKRKKTVQNSLNNHGEKQQMPPLMANNTLPPPPPLQELNSAQKTEKSDIV